MVRASTFTKREERKKRGFGKKVLAAKNKNNNVNLGQDQYFYQAREWKDVGVVRRYQLPKAKVAM